MQRFRPFALAACSCAALVLAACQGTQWGEQLERAVAPITPSAPDFETETPSSGANGVTEGVTGTESTSPDDPAPPASTADPAAILPSAGDRRFSDVDPADLAAPPIAALAELGVFDAIAGDRFQPNRSVRRAEFARWLVLSHNSLYADDPSRQIRVPIAEETPLFLDVPEDHPDFVYIQALGNAGFIEGDAASEFKPGNLLSRADLVALKIQLDLFPGAIVGDRGDLDRTWGFVDGDDIPDGAVAAIASDFTLERESNIRRSFGLLRSFNPLAPVNRAEVAIALSEFGTGEDRRSAIALLESGQLERPVPTPTPALDSLPAEAAEPLEDEPVPEDGDAAGETVDVVPLGPEPEPTTSSESEASTDANGGPGEFITDEFDGGGEATTLP